MKNSLYGAILGDLAGQAYEFPANERKPDYVNLHNPTSHITDDTIMTLATAQSIMLDKPVSDVYLEFGKKYPNAGYGGMFIQWLKGNIETPIDSWGNGCLMRISPFMYLKDKILAQEMIIKSCQHTHNHPKSILSCLRLFNLYSKAGIYTHEKLYNKYLKSFKNFEVAADKTIEFIETAYNSSNSTHTTIIKVIECGGDTDTNASIIGELMNYTYNDLTKEDVDYVESKLDYFLLNILKSFNSFIQ